MSTLKTDYVGDILDTEQNTNRKFNMIENSDGTISFTDATAYEQNGDEFTPEDFNATNEQVNTNTSAIAELATSFSNALTALKNTAIAQAVGATGSTFTSVIATLATIVNRGAVSQTLNTSTTSYTVPEGYHNGSGTVSISTETKTITAGTSASTTSATSGKVISSVTVNPTPSQTKSTTATTSTQNITPDSGKLLSKVTVNPQQHTATKSISGNGTTDLGATHNYRYISNSVGLQLLGTYTSDTTVDVSGITNKSFVAVCDTSQDYFHNDLTYAYQVTGNIGGWAKYDAPTVSLSGNTLTITVGKVTAAYCDPGNSNKINPTTQNLTTKIYYAG